MPSLYNHWLILLFFYIWKSNTKSFDGYRDWVWILFKKIFFLYIRKQGSNIFISMGFIRINLFYPGQWIKPGLIRLKSLLKFMPPMEVPQVSHYLGQLEEWGAPGIIKDPRGSHFLDPNLKNVTHIFMF